MPELPRVGLVGVNGYGRTHLHTAARLHDEGALRLVAYADIAPTAADAVAAAFTGPVRAYPTFAGMLADEDLDVAVLATPIPLHAEMIELAFAHGVSVLVEKPPVVTVQDIDRLLRLQEAQAREGRPVHCQVGFQTARSPVVETLGQLARSGALGTVELVSMIGRWQRSDAYYARTRWAGRLVHDGRYVLDGTLTNPFAHGLMNAFVVAGRDAEHPAKPTSVRAELYRCRDIEGDDTSSVRITTAEGVTVLAAATLCAGEQRDPRIVVKGSRATVSASYTTGNLQVDPPDALEPPDLTTRERPDLLRNLAEVVGGTSNDLLCPLRMCRGFVLALGGIYESAGRPRPVSPPSAIARHENGERWVHLEGVDDLIEHGARDGLLFSEAGARWAVPTAVFSMDNYHRFEHFIC